MAEAATQYVGVAPEEIPKPAPNKERVVEVRSFPVSIMQEIVPRVGEMMKEAQSMPYSELEIRFVRNEPRCKNPYGFFTSMMEAKQCVAGIKTMWEAEQLVHASFDTNIFAARNMTVRVRGEKKKHKDGKVEQVSKCVEKRKIRTLDFTIGTDGEFGIRVALAQEPPVQVYLDTQRNVCTVDTQSGSVDLRLKRWCTETRVTCIPKDPLYSCFKFEVTEVQEVRNSSREGSPKYTLEIEFDSKADVSEIHRRCAERDKEGIPQWDPPAGTSSQSTRPSTLSYNVAAAHFICTALSFFNITTNASPWKCSCGHNNLAGVVKCERCQTHNPTGAMYPTIVLDNDQTEN
jgi:hypothetical protein